MKIATIADARVWIVRATLIALTSELLFFALAPAFGFPITGSEAFRLLQIITPVLLGYLGVAARFAARDTDPGVNSAKSSALLPWIAKGPFVASALFIVASLVEFWRSNRSLDAPIADAMSIDSLAARIAIAASIHTAITSAFVAPAFRKPSAPKTSI